MTWDKLIGYFFIHNNLILLLSDKFMNIKFLLGEEISDVHVFKYGLYVMRLSLCILCVT